MNVLKTCRCAISTMARVAIFASCLSATTLLAQQESLQAVPVPGNSQTTPAPQSSGSRTTAPDNQQPISNAGPQSTGQPTNSTPQQRQVQPPQRGLNPIASRRQTPPATSQNSSQNPTRRAATQPRRRFSSRLTSYSQRRRRLARTPDMLGDSFLPPLQLTLQPQAATFNVPGTVQLALAGGSARAKLAEHNKALPVDRIYASYNHFHNAAQRPVANPSFSEQAGRTTSVDRFTLGLERTLFSGNTSVELRLPLTNYPDAGGSFSSLGSFSSDVGSLGNLSIVGKRLLFSEEDLTISAGLGVEVPTGDGAVTQFDSLTVAVDNDAVFLQPFLAATLDNDATFIHSFLQLDVATNGNSLNIHSTAAGGPPPPGPAASGFSDIDQPTLLHWDTSVGHWLARSDDDRGITGIAAIAEFHLTANLSDTQAVGGIVSDVGGPVEFLLQSNRRQFPATYFTTGLHVEISRDTTLRVAGVFPLAAQNRRLFDSEVLVQIGRRY